MQKPSTVLVKDNIDTIAIGSFDGIHLGHLRLFKELGAHGALFVVDKDQANLTPGLKRSEYSKYPCMYYHFLKVKDFSGKEFVDLLKKEFKNLKKIVVGYDFFFGKDRSYSAKDLQELSGLEVVVVDEFIQDGKSVHSSLIRAFLSNGDVDKANRFLGREYSIIGEVISGQGLGREALYPTMNLKVRDYMLPLNGVYATRTRVGARIFDSVSFLGNRVSTDGNFSIETHILDKDIQNTPEVEIFFVEYLRDNRKFSNLEELKSQITRDIDLAKERLGSCKFYPVL